VEGLDVIYFVIFLIVTLLCFTALAGHSLSCGKKWYLFVFCTSELWSRRYADACRVDFL